jgi:hypothetical protein
MFGWLRGCTGRVLIVVLVAAAGAALWWKNPGIVDRLRGVGSSEPAALGPSPELADATLDRFEAFQGSDEREMRLGDAELSSLVRYSLPGIVPPGVDEPTVTLRDGRIHLSARVALAALPDLPALGEVRALLPDTVPILIRGTLAPFGSQQAALHVDRIEASRIPLPARYVPELLSALGRAQIDDLPPNALLVPLPAGLSAAYVLRDSLVLVASR